MPFCLPENIHKDTRIMVFVDGENLSIRYKNVMPEIPPAHVVYEPDVFVWTPFANVLNHPCEILRRYYYTSAPGDEKARRDIEDRLRDVGIQAPRVFHKDKRKRTKRVDITLATDMLSHAHRKNYDLAVLVSGDEDYVPVVRAVIAEGRRVVLWALSNGLSPALKAEADHFFDIGEFLLKDETYLQQHY